jgi:outer membrane immunogenic protein
MDLHDTFESSIGTVGGPEKESGSWGVGGRIGYIVTPNLLTYFNAGYTQAHFDQINFSDTTAPFTPLGIDIASHTYDGWFIGGGTETSLSGFLGLSLPPGLFLRSEYRYASYSAANLPYVDTATGVPVGLAEHMTKYVQTIGTSLVWKFNWMGH